MEGGAPEWLHPAHAGTICTGTRAARRCNAVGAGWATFAARRRTIQAAAGCLHRGTGIDPTLCGLRAARARIAIQSRSPAFPRSSAIFLSCCPRARRSPAVAETIRALGIAEISSIDGRGSVSRQKRARRKIFAAGARDVREPPGHAHRSAVERFFIAHHCRAGTTPGRVAARVACGVTSHRVTSLCFSG